MIRLRELRESRKLNQQRLAIELNVSQAAISKYELGGYEPDIETLMTMADFFGVSVDYLIGYSDNPQNCKKSDLSVEQQNILNNYNCLKPLQKAKAEAYIKGLLDE